MRLGMLKVKGVTRFGHAVQIDFAAIGPGVIAFAGPNGAGKTTLMECSGPGAVYRELPSRAKSADVLADPLSNWTAPEGGEVELTFSVLDRDYTAKVVVGKGGKSSSAFLSGAGKPLVTGKVRDYDAAMVTLLGPREAFYASVFGIQSGRHGFAAAGVADRKAIFRHYLSMDRLDRLAELARKKLGAIDLTAIETIERELESQVKSRPAHTSRIETAAEAVTTTSDAARLARERADAVAEQAALADLLASYESAMDRAAEAVATAHARTADILPRPKGERPDIAAAQAALDTAHDDEAAINAAEAARDKVQAAMTTLDRQIADSNRRVAVLDRVPCKGGVKFGGCEFLKEAVEAKRGLADLLIRRDTQAGYLATASEEYAAACMNVPDVKGKTLALRAAGREREEYDLDMRRAVRSEDVAKEAQERAQAARVAARELRSKLPNPIPEDLPAPEQVAAVRRLATVAQQAHQDAQREHDRAVDALAALDESISRLKAKRAAARRTAEKADDLKSLVRALGPNGVQAAEIAAAGPRVSDLANDLLDACYGERFSMEIRTLRDTKDGKGVSETFVPWITDAVRGGDGPLERFSGGERVILDEALRTALALFATERRGIVCETLWRDEPGGALDRDNAPRFASMLRRARELGGFHQVLVATHDPNAIEAADAVVWVDEDGQVTVER